MLIKYFDDLTNKEKPVTSRFPQKYVFILFCSALSSIMISIIFMQLFLFLLFAVYLFEKIKTNKML